MKILLVYKKSTYDFYKNSEIKHKLSDEELKNLEKAHKANEVSINIVEKTIEEAGFSVKKVYRADVASTKDCHMIVAVGGDGTFLEAVRYANENQIVIGVNSDPNSSYGNFCKLNANSFNEKFLEILESINYEKCEIKEFSRLVFSIDGEEYKFPASNDLLIHHACPAGLTRYIIEKCYYDFEELFKSAKEEHFCSGLWISSAVGSTGAISSFGGEKMDMSSSEIQILPFGLNKSKKLSYKINKEILDGEITIISKMREGKIYVDGQHVEVDFPYNSVLKVRTGMGRNVKFL